jgi:carbonic anhydrase/acetyltransferase-like protein (isoleucine patch superfamily)
MAEKRVLVTLAMAAALVAGGATVAQGDTGPTFVDPTVIMVRPADVHLGSLVYVGPFATLVAARPIHVGDESNVQDSVLLSARTAPVDLGEQSIMAHGSAAKDGAEIGERGTCPGGAGHCPSFVGFNSEVDGGIVERDAMVLHLARVGPGVRIPSGRKVLSGKNVVTQAQVAAKTAPVTEADRLFMQGVVEVNVSFAKGYSTLAAENPSNVRGINYDPGGTAFNPNRDLPTLAGVPTRDPGANARIIGDVRLADDAVLARQIVRSSLRADEGEPFNVGTVDSMGTNVTFHALEHSHIDLGDHARYGNGAIVHGGPAFSATTSSAAGLSLGRSAVLFQSQVGEQVTIGNRSLVQASLLAAGTVVPDNTVVVDGVVAGRVEW